jgi:serine-type D-Ala-D-Ala carboxypeptidase (penicillin-binding protein 5/6)
MKLLILSFFSFFIVSISTLSIERIKMSEKKVDISPVQVLGNQYFPPLPILSVGSIYPDFSAESITAIDINSGVDLYNKNSDKKLLPASTTKIVTALVSIDYYPMQKRITIDNLKVDGQKMGLMPNEEITVRDLLSGLLIFSANDAAEVLAANYPGGRDEFIKAMNSKAEELNLSSSHFTNPSGLDDAGISTTSRDLVRAATEAMQNQIFREIVGTKSKTVSSTDGKIKHKLSNLNQLLGTVDGVLGVKTGWTENAKENLVTYIERDDKKVMIAVLGSKDRFGETKMLIDWIFANYEWRSVKV